MVEFGINAMDLEIKYTLDVKHCEKKFVKNMLKITYGVEVKDIINIRRNIQQ